MVVLVYTELVSCTLTTNSQIAIVLFVVGFFISFLLSGCEGPFQRFKFSMKIIEIDYLDVLLKLF